MYDCSKEFNKFYRTEVVLPAKEQNELRQKRKLNIKRLKDGLLEYNDEKKKDYKISEERIQGSMAMHTITQNDENDYDIDVGIVFESDNLDDLGPLATRNIVADALERKTKQFAEVPDVKTSCVRLMYSSKGYHVDFAVFKRYKKNSWNDEYIYEHAGAEWSIRHLKALEEWFNDEIKNSGDDLRKITRLSKMFCKSRDSWKNMPSGLIQTIVCNENLSTGSLRLDEIFYHTMKSIVNRLNIYLEVYAPVDNRRPLVTRETDYQRMKNWKNRLDSSLANLDILFDTECTYKDALNAWAQFFNHSYWNELYSSTINESFSMDKAYDFDDTEEFIEDLYFLKKNGNKSVHSAQVKKEAMTALECLKRAFEVAINFSVYSQGAPSSILKLDYDIDLLITKEKSKKSLTEKYQEAKQQEIKTQPVKKAATNTVQRTKTRQTNAKSAYQQDKIQQTECKIPLFWKFMAVLTGFSGFILAILSLLIKIKG